MPETHILLVEPETMLRRTVAMTARSLGMSQVHEAAIAAWEARVRIVADRSPPPVCFDRDGITDDWVRELVALSTTFQDQAGVIQHRSEITLPVPAQ